MKTYHRLVRFGSAVLWSACLLAVPASSAAQQPVETALLRQPQAITYYLSVPPAAFHPMYRGDDYENRGGVLQNNNSSGGVYNAALYLPNGATVTRVTFYYQDTSLANGNLYLVRAAHASDYISIFTTLTSNNLASSVSTTSITYPLIDNAAYMYYLEFVAPSVTSPATENVFLYGALLEYSLPLYSPVTDYRAIPAAGFAPYNGGYMYTNYGRSLNYITASGETLGDFQAPLFLPDQATISGATFYYFDNHAVKNGEAQLHSANLANDWPSLANFSSSYDYGYGSDDRSFSAIIDNRQNGYWVFFRLPSSSSEVMGRSLVVRYAYPTSHSFWEYTSVLAAAFLPQVETQEYDNHGRFLIHYSGADNIYVAPLYLNNGERISSVRFYYYSPGPSVSGSVYLQASRYNSATSTLAWIVTSGTGWTVASQDFPESSQLFVDNQNQTYWLKALLPASGFIACGVVVETTDRLLYMPMMSKQP